jgi:CDP-diacylglycerol---glycerol-3-phosphate 3-phosphatidyltransferase
MKMNPPTQKVAPSKATLTDLLRMYAAVIIDPIVTWLARYRFSPDTLTVLGMASHIFFAWLIASGQMRWAGLAILAISPLDALDGALARKLGRKQAGFGAFLDSTLDRLAEIFLFAGFLYYFIQQNDQWMVATAYAALTGSLMVSYVRARAEALGYQCKVGVLSRVERYIVMIVTLLLNQPEWGLAILAFFTYFTLGQRMLYVWRQAHQ